MMSCLSIALDPKDPHGDNVITFRFFGWYGAKEIYKELETLKRHIRLKHVMTVNRCDGGVWVTYQI